MKPMLNRHDFFASLTLSCAVTICGEGVADGRDQVDGAARLLLATGKPLKANGKVGMTAREMALASRQRSG
jgi:hypothetical protein